MKREAEEVLIAYEQFLFEKHGRRRPAQRTRNMINRRGMIPAVERLVSKKQPSTGFDVLAEEGKTDLTFEAVVLRHKRHFSQKAVERAKQRIG